MIETADLIEFLRKGERLCGISIGMKKQEVIEKFGSQLYVYGDKQVGYMELPKGIRFGYFGNFIDEMAILNEGEDAVYSILVENAGKKISIGPETTIAEAKELLNYSGIKWIQLEPVSGNDTTILTEGYVGLVFYEGSEKLRIVSKTNHTRELFKDKFPLL